MMPTPITYALRALSVFYPPQKPLIFSGLSSSEKLVEFILASGHKRVLLIADSFLVKNKKLDSLLSHLNENHCFVTIFAGAIPNPTLSEVEAGLKLSVDNHCDCVLAIGGGSVIDVAKVIAAASTNRRGLKQLAGILRVKEPPLPFYAVPTTSGSGSEVTNGAVISDPDTHKKQFFVDPKYIPIAVSFDPYLLKSLPAASTAAVGMDAMTHAIEAYISRNRFVETDRDAAMAIKLLFTYLPQVYVDGDDLRAREFVAQAAFLAGYAFTKSSLGYVHAISHQISALYNTPHGLANAIILPRVLRFNQKVCAERFAKLEMMLSEDRTTEHVEVLSTRFIERVDCLSKHLNIQTTLPDLQEQDFKKIAKDALSEAKRSYAVPKVMRLHDVKTILQSIASGNLHLSFN